MSFQELHEAAALPSASAANQLAISLRAEGRLAEAIAVFREGTNDYPEVAELHQNLAHALYEAGDNDGAIAAYQRALEVDPESVAAHLALFELFQITGERSRALEHQRRALERQRVFSAPAPREARSVLVICAPGDWQANIPVDFLFDRQTTTVHKLYLLDEQRLASEDLPPYDIAWNTIAESPESHATLELAERFLRHQPKPSLNAPARVLQTARLNLAKTLAGTGATIAPIVEIARDALAGAVTLFAYPIIARPVGSHAGTGLERIDAADELAGYIERNEATSYYVSPFIDYRNADGFYRKHRIIFVDGEPYPCHLAISPRWMIHYYNAAMAENAWMRDEEARFLEDIRSVYDGERYETLKAIARAVDLEYFGIDSSIGPDGRVLVFEADPAMLVHTSDPIDLYPYKHRYVPRIYRALERMIDKRRPADT